MRRVHAAVTAAPDRRLYSPAILTDVDPFIGTAATCLPPPERAGSVVVVAQAAGRQHPSGRHVTARHGVGLRVLRCLPHRLRPLRQEHRRRARRDVRAGAGVRVHALPAVGHRRDPQVLQLRAGHADGRAARRPRRVVGAARRDGHARVLRGHPRHRGALRDHRGREGGRAPVHVPRDAQCPGRARPVVRRARHRARPHGAAAGPRREHGVRPRAGHRRDGGRAALGLSGGARARTGGRCSGTTAG